MKKIRWGLLSTANINRRVIPAIRESKRGDLVAVSSRDLDKAQQYAKKWEIPTVFGSYQEMLDSGKVDAVYISLPNHLHAEWSIKAMKAGVHVLCEKPFAITLEQVDAMIAAKEQTGMILAEAFMYRHHPQTRKTGELVHSGKLGEISLVRGTFDFAFESRENVRLVPEWGGGCLWDVGVYPLSFAQYIYGGPPDWVMGAQWLGDSGVDETFSGQMGYPGDRFAQIGAAFRTPFYTFVEVIGTKGRLHIDLPFIGVDNSRMILYNQKGKAKTISVSQKYLYLGEIEDMHAAILDSKPNYISLEETRNHIRTVLALYESARKGQVIHL
jgi:D-xylose 1-dehydrogenase (NADP+, D-xylono-1,5-lactone-forming)